MYLLRDSDIDVDIDLQAAIAAAGVAKSVVGHDLPSALLRAGDRIAALMPDAGTAQATLTAKGRQTRAAIEQAARKLFAERGFHGTTLADITSAAGKSAGGVLSVLRRQRGSAGRARGVVPARGRDAVRAEPASAGLPRRRRVLHLGGHRLLEHVQAEHRHHDRGRAAGRPPSSDLPLVQNEFRRFGMDIVAASVRHVQQHGYGTELNPEHIAAAIALLFENFTTVFVGPSGRRAWAWKSATTTPSRPSRRCGRKPCTAA